MSTPLLRCINCYKSLPLEVFNTPGWTHCPACGVKMQVAVFPAFFQALPAATIGEKILVEGESGCFYHPQKKAALPCESCGRFLCALCDVELSGRHLCPGCIATGKKKGRIKNLENHRVLYDTIALGLATLPLLLFWMTLLTAPMALFMALRYWKAPSSI